MTVFLYEFSKMLLDWFPFLHFRSHLLRNGMLWWCKYRFTSYKSKVYHDLASSHLWIERLVAFFLTFFKRLWFNKITDKTHSNEEDNWRYCKMLFKVPKIPNCSKFGQNLPCFENNDLVKRWRIKKLILFQENRWCCLIFPESLPLNK